MPKGNPVVLVMGSDSDLPKLASTLTTLDEFGIGCDVRVLSAHRTPEDVHDFAVGAAEAGCCVIIAAAGGAAHLAGVLASLTTLPVIGVPLESGALRGVDALYSTVQMPPGVPVATVAIGGAKNAGILALQILATADDSLVEALQEFKGKLTEQVLAKDRQVQAELSS